MVYLLLNAFTKNNSFRLEYGCGFLVVADSTAMIVQHKNLASNLILKYKRKKEAIHNKRKNTP
jgi:hypothetical protein